MDHLTASLGLIRRSLFVVCGGVGLALLGCQPDKPALEIKAPGVDIQVEQPEAKEDKGDVKIDVDRPHKSEDIKIDIEKPAKSDAGEPKS